MTSSIVPSAERPPMTTIRILSLLIGIFIAGWLALAPYLRSLGGMVLFHYIPANFEAFALIPRSGILPAPAIGLITTAAAFLLEAVVFLPAWILSRKRANWEPLHAIAGGLLAASLYLLAWSLAGLPFPAESAWPSVIRIILTSVLLLAWLRPIRRWAPATLGAPSASTMLLALGAAAVLLLPWLVLGALGTVPQTLSALAQAFSYGAGEELLLRALIPALLARATGRPRLGFLLGLLIGLALQPGYILPLGDWLSLFRLFNTVADRSARHGTRGARIVMARDSGSYGVRIRLSRVGGQPDGIFAAPSRGGGKPRGDGSAGVDPVLRSTDWPIGSRSNSPSHCAWPSRRDLPCWHWPGRP